MLFESSRVRFRKMTKEDTALYHKWRNDVEVMHFTNPSLDVYPLEATKEFVEHVILGAHAAKSTVEVVA
ncbi:GNAT family N-acetyltransferase [Paenibacillaceae bacterium WGS1546]|uniref:GNAT family N-acetyltransferase n=1 Tax=Cohnella sp. WGS1546 TaxID=3366810 RepID=UPI00372CF87C